MTEGYTKSYLLSSHTQRNHKGVLGLLVHREDTIDIQFLSPRRDTARGIIPTRCYFVAAACIQSVSQYVQAGLKQLKVTLASSSFS